MPNFKLHERLAADSALVGHLPLCQVRLILDANYPWLILVPERADIREMHALTEADQGLLTREIARVSQGLETLTGATKMNVAALGNMVPQLHIHIVARFEGDPAWPGAIWGAVDAKPYAPEAREDRLHNVREALQLTA